MWIDETSNKKLFLGAIWTLFSFSLNNDFHLKSDKKNTNDRMKEILKYSVTPIVSGCALGEASQRGLLERLKENVKSKITKSIKKSKKP